MATRTILTPANVVTMARIVLSPFVVAAIYFYAPSWWVLLFGFIALVTDQVDGFLARRYGISDLGIFLDPLADKILVLGSFAVLVVNGWIWWFPAALIAAREIAMSWWRSKFARQGISVPARKLAKYKMWVQSVAIALALTPGIIANAHWLVTTSVWIAVVITWYTFYQYLRDSPTAAK